MLSRVLNRSLYRLNATHIVLLKHPFQRPVQLRWFSSEHPKDDSQKPESPILKKPNLTFSKGLDISPETGGKYGGTTKLFSWNGVSIIFVFGLVIVVGSWIVADVLEMRKEKQRKKTVGKADIGGPFELIDHDGKPVGSRDFLGKWCLIYFGFTHCPDICPEQLERLCELHKKVTSYPKMKDKFVPLMISVDPDRDGPEEIKKYLSDFDVPIIGLTGTSKQIRDICRKYRIYFSDSPKDQDGDYIVDHTVMFYLINPAGNFVEYFPQNVPVNQILLSINQSMRAWEASH